ncbi:MAG: Ldh family oxidoreductase [Phycisphaeraceae bacterium]
MAQPVTEDAIRVPHERLHSFVLDAAQRVGLSAEHATRLAELLIASDLRGVLSHGSRLMGRYVREIRAGGINPQPRVALVQEGPTSVTVDGDGGLGYFPADDATRRVITKAREHGMAAMVTRNHGHIGAAGHYTRMTLEHDLLTFMTSGVKLRLEPGKLVTTGAGASPMSFTAPTLDEPAVVLDIGVTHDIQGNAPHRDELAQLAPGLVLRALGLGSICQAWGGLLTGISMDAEPPWASANQGAMMFALRIDLFSDVDRFKREMDTYARQVRELQPLANMRGPYLPGGVEVDNEQQFRMEGVPLNPGHQRELTTVAETLGVALPW